MKLLFKQQYQPGRVNQKGTALLLSMLVLSIILAIALATASVMTSEVRMSVNVADSSSAFYISESGVECAMHAVKNDSDPSMCRASLNNGNYSVKAQDMDDFFKSITVIGEYKNNKRAIQLIYLKGDGTILESGPEISNIKIIPLSGLIGTIFTIQAGLIDSDGIKSAEADILDNQGQEILSGQNLIMNYQNNNIYQTIWASDKQGSFCARITAYDNQNKVSTSSNCSY